MIIGKIIKYIDNNIDKIFKITYGSKYDENSNLYSKEYKYELQEFKETFENNLKLLEKCGTIFGTNEIYQQFILDWFDSDVFTNINACNELRVFIHIMLYDIYYPRRKHYDLKLDKNDNELIKSLIYNKISDIQKELIELCLTGDNSSKKLFNMFKQIQGEEETNIYIKEQVKKYIRYNNIYYKLYGIKNDNKMFNIVCREYNIKRSEFIF